MPTLFLAIVATGAGIASAGGAEFLGVISALCTIGTVAEVVHGRLKAKMSKTADEPIPPWGVAGGVVGTVLLLGTATIVAVSSRETPTPNASGTPSSMTTPSSTTLDPAPSATATTPTVPPTPLTAYCEYAIEFLARVPDFSAKGWEGQIKKSDFDPIIESATAAKDAAPSEMRAPMVVLVSNYVAAQDRWSDDNMLKNIPLAIGTILSPNARRAAHTVDIYENENCF